MFNSPLQGAYLGGTLCLWVFGRGVVLYGTAGEYYHPDEVVLFPGGYGLHGGV